MANSCVRKWSKILDIDNSKICEISVSITTVTYNSEQTIRRTIESVLNQDYENIEYIIVDGNSSDSTVEIAKSYCERFKNRGIHYLVISENDNGMYDAINRGIKVSHGQIIGNINSDDWYESDAIRKVVEFYRKNSFDFMYANLRVIRSDGSSYVKKARRKRLIHTSRNWNHPTQFAVREIFLEYPYQEINLFDDFDLYTHVLEMGYKVEVLNEVIANFSLGGMSYDTNIKQCLSMIGKRYSIYRRHKLSKLYIFECILMEGYKFFFQK